MSRSRRSERGGRHLVPGERAVHELLSGAAHRVRRLIIEDGRDFEALEQLAQAAGVHIERSTRERLDEAAGPGMARGVLAVASPPPTLDVEDLLSGPGRQTRSGRRIVVGLDEVVDPHNLGAIMRSAEYFGAQGLFWAKDRGAALGPAAVRASAGASERLGFSRPTNLVRALEACKAADYWVVGTVVEGGAPLTSFSADPPERMCVVFGSEQRGIRRLTRDRCDFLVSVQGTGDLGSLNVSAAAAVVLAALA